MRHKTFTRRSLRELENLVTILLMQGWQIEVPMYVNWRCAFAIRMWK